MPQLDKQKMQETKLCECGCGAVILRYRHKTFHGLHAGYYERHYIVGHARKGKKTSEEHKQKISDAQKGKKRGDAWNKGKSNWWAKGELNNKWKGGITPESTILRHSTPTKEWRNAIYKIYDYTCQICGAKSSKKNTLNAHHVKTWSEYPDLRWDLANGICLCKNCHDQIKGREHIFEAFFIAIIKNRVNSGEPQTDNAVGNPEPSLLNGIKVDRKVQRLTGEEPTNKPDTSARHESDDIVCPA